MPPRFNHTPNTTKADMSANTQNEARLADLQAEIDEADTEHRRLVRLDAADYAHLRLVHLAAARVWTLTATKLREEGNHDGARKAMSTASEQAILANKLEQNSGMDRLAELERFVMTSRQDAQRLASWGTNGHR